MNGLASLASLLLFQQGLPHPQTAVQREELVWSERALTFYEEWGRATEERRAAVEAALSELTSPGSPLDRRPSFSDLCLLIRVLRGEELAHARADELARFADGLDLRLVPGLFFAEVPDERGTPLTVHAIQLTRERLAGEIELSLYWSAPDGTESRARTEPFSAPVFEVEVPLYVRAPRGPAGRWTLVPEVRRDDRRVRGAPVPVWCLPGSTATDSHAGDRAFDALVARGERSLWPPGASVTTTIRCKGTARAGLVFLAPRGEDPALVLTGRLGELWRELAERDSVILGSISLALGDNEPLEELLRTWRAEGFGPIVLVARGEAALTLHWLAPERSLEVDGLVLCGSIERPGAALPSVPTLVVHTRATATSDTELVRHVRGADTAFLSEPVLPALVEAWLPSLLARSAPRSR